MPNVEYDIDVEKELKKRPKYSHYVSDFMKSEHENMRIECRDISEAINVAKALCTYRCRNKIYNLLIVRRKNIVLLMRNEV